MKVASEGAHAPYAFGRNHVASVWNGEISHSRFALKTGKTIGNQTTLKTILLIEDDHELRKSLASVLTSHGFRVAQAVDGKDGIAEARTIRPELIVCDVTMPEMTGHEVIQSLQESRATAGIPFLFLSARDEMADLREGMNLGADDYLTKPVSIPDLIAAIEVRLKRREAQLKLEEKSGFDPDFESHLPLQSLGLTPREAEVLLWVAQGKSNSEISTILTMSEGTVKKHLQHIFEKLGVESRNGAAMSALEVLCK